MSIEVETYKSAEIEDKPLNPVPIYYSNLVDMPYVSRMDGGTLTSSNIFKIVDFKDFTMPIDEFGSGSFQYFHNLGYAPIIRGSYYISSATTVIGSPYPVGRRGLIPENRYAEYGAAIEDVALIQNLDETQVTIAMSFGFTGQVIGRIYLLRERSVK